LVDDLRAWLQRLQHRPEVDATRLIYHGRSIGGGVACALASVHPPQAMILQSTFTCIADVARRFGVPRALITEPFDNLTVIRQARFPCLIMHGTRDRLIPFSHAAFACVGSRTAGSQGGFRINKDNAVCSYAHFIAISKRRKLSNLFIVSEEWKHACD
jgi:pimeloyl-ACP methyl ester carboxylesterase